MKTYDQHPVWYNRDEQKVRYSKPERLIEKVSEQPTAVIQEVFSELLLTDLQEDLLPTWFQVAFINASGPYADGNSRKMLHEFYEQLLLFVTALHELSANNQFDYLSAIADFFQQFSIEYVRRELADFLEAGIGYKGDYPNGFTPWLAWMTYDNVLCLVEAAYQLYITGFAKESKANQIEPENWSRISFFIYSMSKEELFISKS